MSNQSKKIKLSDVNLALDTELKIFLKRWFSGFLEGKEQLENENWPIVSEICGRACAHIHSGELFWQTWEATRNLVDFIIKRNEFHGEEIFKIVDCNTIFVNYSECRCPLVKFNIVNSPLLCNCYDWLSENFSSILKKPVKVLTENTISKGAKSCNFYVFFET